MSSNGSIRNCLPIFQPELIRYTHLKKTVVKKIKTVQKQTKGSPDPAAVLPESKGTKMPRRVSTRAKKSTAKPGAKTTKSKATPSSDAGEALGPTDEQIRLRAYFIAERRQRLALTGDASSDWLEAKKQLLSESGSR